MEHEDMVFGIHYGHDSTVVLMKDGVIVEAMSEERLSRQKKHMGFPHLALSYIKEKYNISSCKNVVIVGENPAWDGYVFTTKEDNEEIRKMGTPHAKDFLRAIGFKFPLLGKVIAFRDALLIKTTTSASVGSRVDAFLQETLPGASITRISHHLAHAWATVPFLPDTKTKRLILTLDGAGDNLSGSINMYEHGALTQLHTIPMSASIGLLYCAIVDLLGMSRNEHEFKVMGLAPYAKASSGEKVYEKLKKLVWFDEESMTVQSSIPLNRATPYLLANEYYYHRFDSLAYGIQKLTEELIKDMARAAIKKYKVADIAVGGGVFMNVKANQYLLELPEVKSLVVVPSCGDESLAIGAATFGYAMAHNNLSGLKKINNLYLGSSYSNEDIKKSMDVYPFVKECSVTFFDPVKGESIERRVAELLAANNVVGRFKGRAEWGARALGNRSILANPSSRDNVKLINEMIKGRDFWMPFATSLLYEERNTYLEVTKDFFAPYMSITFNTKERAHKELIAALHPYDLTSRPQMVTKEMNKEYHELISHFHTTTNVGGILNTSFNLHGEPNVEVPYDALRTFELSGLKYLALGDYLISKK